MKYDDEGRRERVGDAVKMKCEINSDEGRVDCNEGEPGGGGCRVEMYDLFNVESSALGSDSKYPGIWEISKILKIYHSQITIRIWEISGISQMPGYLGNFPNA